jgi:hypothetical protein
MNTQFHGWFLIVVATGLLVFAFVGLRHLRAKLLWGLLLVGIGFLFKGIVLVTALSDGWSLVGDVVVSAGLISTFYAMRKRTRI